jgi:hypothetical protein
LFPKFAKIAKPYTKRQRKEATFNLESRQQLAFDKLREVLCSDQILPYPDFNAQFILTTDASKVALVTVKTQVQDGVYWPIFYASRQMNQAEQKFPVSEVEMFAVTCTTKNLCRYVYGKKFLVCPEHTAYKYLHKFADNNSRFLHWCLRLVEFDFEVEHRAGSQIRHVHALRRHVQTVTTKYMLSKEVVNAEQHNDSFCSTLQVGNAKGRT